MPIRSIVLVSSPEAAILRQRAAAVRRIDRDLRRLLDDMVETMREAPGVGLAAPQIGLGLRAIVVETPLDEDDPERGTRVFRLADPEIVAVSDALAEDQEACLSIPGLFGDVPRHERILVRALDYTGRRVELDLIGFEARVFQHEIDHLNGVLFTDRVTGPDKLYALREAEDGSFERVPCSEAAVAAVAARADLMPTAPSPSAWPR